MAPRFRLLKGTFLTCSLVWLHSCSAFSALGSRFPTRHFVCRPAFTELAVSSPESIDDVPSRVASLSHSEFSISTPSKERLLAPEEIASITELVDRRSEARYCGDYDLADSIRRDIDGLGEGESISDGRGGTVRLPTGYKVELRDIPRREGGGTTWEVVSSMKVPLEWVSGDDDGGESVLRLSHAAVGLATSTAEKNVLVDVAELEGIVQEAESRLKRTGATELRGRKAADAAFWFALAGVTSKPGESSIVDSLAYVAVDELRRFGMRASCRAKDVMHIVERLAAAGVTGEPLRLLSAVAADCLEVKGYVGCNASTSERVVKLLRNGGFDLHSDRPLLWIWRFSIRQRKQRSFLRVAARQYESVAVADLHDNDSVNALQQSDIRDVHWETIFKDPSLPLVVDIGSGMGVSIHGLATITGKVNELSAANTGSLESPLELDWQKSNFAGTDLSRLAIGFAKGISTKSGVDKRLGFFVEEAEDFLEKVKRSYPGEVRLIMIQFPTPFRLQHLSKGGEGDGCGVEEIDDAEHPGKGQMKERGNAQLPKHPFVGFMVTKTLLCCAYDILEKSRGALLLQSNCEDVAVMMRKLAMEAGFKTIDIPNRVTNLDDIGGRLPQRTAEWIRMGGERAEGEGWSKGPLLPRRGATETEVACFLEGTPVHRCALFT